MKTKFLQNLIWSLPFLALFNANAQQLAFPGAVGFGAHATGGRGGTIYHVTNLNDAGTGSFRDAVSASNRIVVFDVGGYINLATAVSVKSNLTIAGQTAPGDGIGVMGREVSFSGSSNIIVRYFRFRQGDLDPATDKSGINLLNGTNMIFDHVSIEFAQWNNIDAVGASNITVQYSIDANPIGQQFAAHTETGPYTWYNNLFANSHNRCPLAKANTQYINNVVYDYQAGYTAGNTAGLFSHDLIGNYFITGPRTTSAGNAMYQVNNQSFYMSGNYLDSNNDGSLNGSALNAPSGTVTLTSPWSSTTSSIPAKTAAQAYADIIAKAGASLHRDQVDALVVADVTSLGKSGNLWSSQTATGLGNSGYGTLNGGTAPTDTDKDGMPDTWETANGLNPNSASDANTVGSDGYTMIEKYINSLVTPVQQYTLTTSVSGSGSVSPSSGTYSSGTNVTITATPVSGWKFDSWSGAVTGTTNPITITMNANKTLTAKFVQNTATTYTLSTTVSGSGSISPSSGTYNSGTNVSLTATPVSGWKFAGWSGAITSSANPVTITMDANKSITATFTFELILEAENATLYQSVTETTNSGYSGSSYVNTNNVVGSYVEWTASIGVAGSYGIEVRNANGTTTDRPANILVNGTTIASAKSFPGTGAWTTWVLSSKISASLIAGSNKIRVVATTANGCANLDYLRITSSNLKSQLVENPISTLSSAEKVKIECYPNPFSSNSKIVFTLPEAAHLTLNIYNAQGILVKKLVNAKFEVGMHEIEIEKGDLIPGIYFCKLNVNGSLYIQKIMIL